jgi:putative transport protein
VDDADLDIPVVAIEITLTNRALAGQSLREIGRILGEKSRGVFLRKVTRAGNTLPPTMETVLERGDVLTVVGGKRNVEQVEPEIGYAEWVTSATDMVTVGIAVVLGGLIGLACRMPPSRSGSAWRSACSSAGWWPAGCAR